ncbi:MAG: ABC transporter permease [Bacteroidales bacterium]|jgi:ABC-type multidrug transport system permease subunit
MNSIIRYRQMWQLIAANFKEIIREPGVLFWGILFPILMSVGLGLAFTKKQDVTRKVAIIKESTEGKTEADSTHILSDFLKAKAIKTPSTGNNEASYSYIIKNEKLGNTTFIFSEISWQQSLVWLKRGLVSIVLEEKKGSIEYHFDPSNADAKLTYLQLSVIFGKKDMKIKVNEDEIKPLTLEGTRYIDFLIPGLIAMGIMMSAMWGLSYTVIERRSRKLLRRMVATPMKKSHFLIALIVVRVAMNFVEAFLLFLFAHFAFGINIQGSIPALIAVLIAGNIAFAGIAILASCNTSKTEIGNGLINVIVMPMMILSGVFFSYHNFPDWSISVIQKLPLTMLADGMRSIFIEGGGFAEIAIPSVILTAIGVFFFGLGLKLFKWH